uniref:Capsid protein n=1 Tax=Tarsiger cyanurus CRESS-DNA-virus sp. TaxID=2815060 RepID=A0A8A4XCF3_9VIRU|nr:MAG: capsid protein [Tarsiger cyanurus CRESS-DNA-virus sp.]
MAFRKMRRTFRKRNFRRRLGRRRVGRRKNSTTAWNSISSSAARGIQFKSRKGSLRQWRRTLYRDTQALSHYRSALALVGTITTGTTPGFGNVGAIHPEFGTVVSTDPFWTATGGFEVLDVGAGVPTFRGDITLRGGKIGITLSVPDSVTDAIACDVYLMFKIKRPIAFATVFAALEPLGFDPSANADVPTNFGSVLFKRSGVLDYNNKTLTVEHRVKPRKIDQITFGALGNQFCWLIHVVNTTSATDVTVNHIKYHNFSFSADTTT